MRKLLLFSATMAPRTPSAIHAGTAEMPSPLSLWPQTQPSVATVSSAQLSAAQTNINEDTRRGVCDKKHTYRYNILLQTSR